MNLQGNEALIGSISVAAGGFFFIATIVGLGSSGFKTKIALFIFACAIAFGGLVLGGIFRNVPGIGLLNSTPTPTAPNGTTPTPTGPTTNGTPTPTTPTNGTPTPTTPTNGTPTPTTPTTPTNSLNPKYFKDFKIVPVFVEKNFSGDIDRDKVLIEKSSCGLVPGYEGNFQVCGNGNTCPKVVDPYDGEIFRNNRYCEDIPYDLDIGTFSPNCYYGTDMNDCSKKDKNGNLITESLRSLEGKCSECTWIEEETRYVTAATNACGTDKIGIEPCSYKNTDGNIMVCCIPYNG